MLLKEFRVYDYRSIEDGEPVKVENLTVLIGRNESGKSNLLRALHYLKPSEGEDFPDKDLDFPRHKEMKGNPTFIHSTWELDEDECKELKDVCPQISYPCEVYYEKGYKGKRIFDFSNPPSAINSADKSLVPKISRKLLVDLHKLVESLDGEAKPLLEDTVEQFEVELDMEKFNNGTYVEWVGPCLTGIEKLRNSLTEQNLTITETTENRIEDLAKIASNVKAQAEEKEKARILAFEKIPTFIYIHEYPKIYGQYELDDFLSRRKEEGGEQTLKDVSLEKLFKAAKIDPEELRGADIRKRKIITSKGSKKLTARINKLWRNTQLDISIEIDTGEINVYIEGWEDGMAQKGGTHWKRSTSQKEITSEIHLDQQSAGFRWFFNFYVTFLADTDFDTAKDRILLLDEPGLHLHAQSQHDLLQHFEKNFKNQIIYTTHSPFMMPDQLKGVRFVRLGDDGTTKVTGNLKKDLKKIQENFFREEIALGLSLEQSKRLAPYVLIVEGITDVAILRAVSYHFRHHKGQEEKAIQRNIAIKPANGVEKVTLFTSILFAEKVGMMVLLDHEPSALIERDRLLLFNRVREANALTVSAAFGKSVDKFDRNADIEDVLGDNLYGKLVEESYPSFAAYKEKYPEKVKDFIKICKTKRIAKCYEEMFKQFRKKDKDDEFKKLKLKFEKMAPIETFCELMLDSQEASKMISGEVEERFTRLFERINKIENDVFDEEIDEDDDKNKKTKKTKKTKA